MTTTAPQPSRTASPARRPLSGRVAVVTGASSGIGEATAWELAAQGAHVALLARRGERLAEHAARIEEAGGTALALPADVTDRASLASAAAGVRARFGRVDLVVNNAGLALPDLLDGSAGGTWQRMIDVNVTGAFAVAEEFVPDLLAAAAERGHADLVNISSAAARTILPGFAGYAASKAAFSHLSHNLRARLSPADVRVTTVEPGAVDTELRDHIGDPAVSAAVQEAMEAIGTLPSGAEVAELIAFAVSRPRHVNLSHLSVLPTREV
ncbi:SDR family oxidoreductase [Streptomyces aureocirculatus]|uniref:SDR family oxidoreductase n=1 Tax=Streptomyces aureocirculatus TaxID=67275 RepID=UPI0006924B12|nr:SDR family oxidoreductase [Streptomyces aureocirculatus]